MNYSHLVQNLSSKLKSITQDRDNEAKTSTPRESRKGKYKGRHQKYAKRRAKQAPLKGSLRQSKRKSMEPLSATSAIEAEDVNTVSTSIAPQNLDTASTPIGARVLDTASTPIAAQDLDTPNTSIAVEDLDTPSTPISVEDLDTPSTPMAAKDINSVSIIAPTDINIASTEVAIDSKVNATSTDTPPENLLATSAKVPPNSEMNYASSVAAASSNLSTASMDVVADLNVNTATTKAVTGDLNIASTSGIASSGLYTASMEVASEEGLDTAKDVKVSEKQATETAGVEDIKRTRHEERDIQSNKKKKKIEKGIPEFWENVENVGCRVPGTWLVPCKTPLADRYFAGDNLKRQDRILDENLKLWTPGALAKETRELGYDVRLVIDLTNTTKYYLGNEIEQHDIGYAKIFCEGFKDVPKEHVVKQFIAIVDLFTREHPGKQIAVHCTHGLNRTGYLVVQYIMHHEKYADIHKVITRYRNARPPGIVKYSYLKKLYEQYGQDAQYPELPKWAEEKYKKV